MTSNTTLPKINNTFTQELSADPNTENFPRQVYMAAFSYVEPKKTSNPELLHLSLQLADSLGIDTNDKKYLTKLLTGNLVAKNTKPYAMCYGGHQFGNWAGQLGDGRAINLMQIENKNQSNTLQLKGAGPTPYSRAADGLAVLRSSVREYLCSEAMHHLGVPTTRALSLALTGDKVLRDILYNGNQAFEKGAVVCRVAPSFIRFGNFEIFASRKDIKNLKALTDFTIRHHYTHLGQPSKETYLNFFREIAFKTIDMVIHWQRVGFVHGVMNTDNMSIHGLTIDFGPYGWLEGYDPAWTPNTTDLPNKRYRYGYQGNIALWNTIQLANALHPLIEDIPALESILNEAKNHFISGYQTMMANKIGLFTSLDEDKEIIQSLESALQATETDMTIFFRNLANYTKDTKVLDRDSKDFLHKVLDAFYDTALLTNDILNQWADWFDSYFIRLQKETLSDTERKVKMNQINPKYVLRNYMAQLAIDKADKEDYTLITELFDVLEKPYDEQPNAQKWFAKRPEWARSKVGCSMLSCSS